jgi:hypothetical protein
MATEGAVEEFKSWILVNRSTNLLEAILSVSENSGRKA